MDKDLFITIKDVSDFCEVEVSVLEEWAECGLITALVLEKTRGIDADGLREIRRVARLYRELGVNREGIEIIAAMRNRILEMSRELALLRHELEQRENDHRLRHLEIPRAAGLMIDYHD